MSQNDNLVVNHGIDLLIMVIVRLKVVRRLIRSK